MAAKKTTKRKSSKAVKKSLTKVESPAKQVVQAMPSPLANLSEKQRRSLTLGLLVILIVAALAYYFKGEFIAATVNGAPVTRRAIVKQLEKQAGKQTLDALVTTKLVEQEAKKRGIALTDAEVLKKIEDTLKAQGQSLDAVLQAQNLTKDYIVESARPQFLLEKMLEGRVTATDKEVADFIEKNKEAFGETATEDDIKKTAKAQVTSQKFSTEAQKLIEELKKNAKVNYYTEY